MPGDGDVLAELSILPNAAYGIGTASAQVTIKDDDQAASTITPVPTLNEWLLMLLSLGLGGLAWRQRRQ